MSEVGDTFSNRDNLKRQDQALEKDLQFNKDMSDAIDNLKRMPRYKNKIWDKVTKLH
jgi:hypothetical protein